MELIVAAVDIEFENPFAGDFTQLGPTQTGADDGTVIAAVDVPDSFAKPGTADRCWAWIHEFLSSRMVADGAAVLVFWPRHPQRDEHLEFVSELGGKDIGVFAVAAIFEVIVIVIGIFQGQGGSREDFHPGGA